RLGDCHVHGDPTSSTDNVRLFGDAYHGGVVFHMITLWRSALMTSAEVAQPPIASDRDEKRPFTIGLTAASSVGLSPRWVQYSGVSATACKAAEALTDLATMSTRGDQQIGRAHV